MQQILEQLGYLKSESSVYEALLKIGPSTAGKIAKETKLSRVSVYAALEKLIKEGLVSYTLQVKRKTFKAVNPSKVKNIIQEKKKQLTLFEEKIPLLIKQFKEQKEEVQTDVYEGIRGLKTILEEFLKIAKEGDEWFVLGGPKKAEILGGFFKDLNQRRARKKVKLKIIYNKDAKPLIEARKKQLLTEVKIMPENYITPTSIEILNNKVAIILYSPIIITYSIENKEVADSFRHYFNLIWRNSEKL